MQFSDEKAPKHSANNVVANQEGNWKLLAIFVQGNYPEIPARGFVTRCLVYTAKFHDEKLKVNKQQLSKNNG